MKRLIIVFLVMAGLVSCNGGKSFKVNVNLENSNDKTVYLQRYDGEVMKKMDSVVAKNNTAVFKVKKSDNIDALHIMIDGWRRPLTFFADNQDVIIDGDYQKFGGIEVKASENQKKLDDFMTEAGKIDSEDELYMFAMGFVKDNIEHPMSVYAMNRYKWAFPLADLKQLYGDMANVKSGYKNLVIKYIKGLEITSPGSPYIDFTQKDINGNDFKMSSVIGKSKIIILDFWASWCPDCRKENPNLVAVYNDFKDKGLDIVSVSLDTDEAAWKKGIEDDNLTWKNHVSDLKGWGNSVAEMYTIAFIPQNFILDENGKILEKNLTGDKLRDFIEASLR